MSSGREGDWCRNDKSIVLGVVLPMAHNRSGRTARLPLPLPNDPPLAGVRLVVQSFHVDKSGFGSSPGLELGVIR